MYQEIIDITTGKPSKYLIQRMSDGAFIPVNEMNVDYQTYKQWLAKGNKPKAVNGSSEPKAVKKSLKPLKKK